ncbi:coiled-coil domain-containing protein 97 [Ostrinia nubilalis]|uniref:coiled-coil domain-containing protein 97 n=1 Tax=Ostrinia furnacalis TaxID=93504 RepID=UPI001040D971|nr:coiled-coil domain-containing protein 97 [Ostrinia furnacalis]
MDKSQEHSDIEYSDDDQVDVDPIFDIIDYLVRCTKISFKNAHVNEEEARTSDKLQIAHDVYKKSPLEFLLRYGKYLTPNHIQYFENVKVPEDINLSSFQDCVEKLKVYHSAECKHKRVRNRRYRALQKLQNESDYFSEKQMMSRNPLLYEQLIGQYLTDEEIHERDGIDRENLTFLDLILETVDRNQIRETKNEQMLEEDLESMSLLTDQENEKKSNVKKKKQWGDFDTVDTTPTFTPEVRKQSMISAPERRLLREEFLHEMYSSFVEGRDTDVDYSSIDNDEQYDDLDQLSQDAEDKYFDSETNDVENLEQHMKLVEEYGNAPSKDNTAEDSLDVFMTHITNKVNNV